MDDQRDCPFLQCETTAYRCVGLDLAEPGSLCITRAWSCHHPFHGLTLELGDAWRDVQERCRTCGLPRVLAESAADETGARRAG